MLVFFRTVEVHFLQYVEILSCILEVKGQNLSHIGSQNAQIFSKILNL